MLLKFLSFAKKTVCEMASEETNYIDSVKKELLIFGYIRKLEKNLALSYDFPKGIIKVIIMHYPTTTFKFRKVNGAEISEDGLTLKVSGINHSIRFGQFLNKKESIIFKVMFHMKQLDTFGAIGFITPKFEEKIDPAISMNMGGNHSCCVTRGHYFMTSPEDFTSETHTRGGIFWVTKDGVECDFRTQS